jgi:hypothetical protein
MGRVHGIRGVLVAGGDALSPAFCAVIAVAAQRDEIASNQIASDG